MKKIIEAERREIPPCTSRPLTCIGVQLEVGQGKKAIVIFVPVPLLQGFHKVQQRYVISSPQGAPHSHE